MFLISVVHNLPHLFHIVTLLSSIGPVFVRASVHGLVCNVIHSLCTRAEELQLKGLMQHKLSLFEGMYY